MIINFPIIKQFQDEKKNWTKRAKHILEYLPIKKLIPKDSEKLTCSSLRLF